MRGEPSSAGLAFDHFTVQRASRSFCASLAGLSDHPAGMRPSLMSRFSASVLRCFGAAMMEAIDRRHGLIRTWTVTDAARHDGAQLPALISKANTGSDVWGDTAYRSRANERLLAENGRRSQIHRKKPPRKPMPKHTARAGADKSKVRAAVEHVFAHEKGPMGLVVRTIGLAGARVKIGFANLVYNMNERSGLPAGRPGIGGRRRPDAGPSITPIDGSQATDLASAEPNQPAPTRHDRVLGGVQSAGCPRPRSDRFAIISQGPCNLLRAVPR